MANEENLKPFTSNQSREETVKNAQKGGVASGRARRRKKLLKDTVNMLLALPMQEGRLDRLTDLKSIKDKNITVEEAMVLKQIQNAMKGDLKAFESIIALSESHNKIGEQPKAQETDNAFIEALNGISGATYKRNGKLVQYSLEGTVRRDTLTAVNKLANKSSETLCEELGAEYVEISSHLGARTHPTNPIANHAGWQGKVFKIDGSDKKYPNLKESTGYPDDILGLGGVNCRHRMFPFLPGISTPNPIRFNEEENRRVYELTQKQRSMERRMRQLKKEQAAAKAIGDTETAAKLKTKISEQSNKIDEFCKKNGLKRDFSRELVKEQIVKNKSVANSENSGIINAASQPNYYDRVVPNPEAKFKVKIDGYDNFVNNGLSEACKNVADEGFKNDCEMLRLVNLDTGAIEYEEIGTSESVGNESFWKFASQNSKKRYAFVHNHNTMSSFSETDMRTLLSDNCVDMFVVSRADGIIMIVEKNKTPETLFFDKLYADKLEPINKKSRTGEISPGDRTFLREKTIVDNLIKEYTKGLIIFE